MWRQSHSISAASEKPGHRLQDGADRQLCDLRMRWLSARSLRQASRSATRQRMSDELSQRILAALVRMPDWLRRDLSSKDDANRQRAEESLSAMIARALGKHADS